MEFDHLSELAGFVSRVELTLPEWAVLLNEGVATGAEGSWEIPLHICTREVQGGWICERAFLLFLRLMFSWFPIDSLNIL